MGRKAGFKGPKDPFADLTTDFKDAVAGSTRDEIENRIAKVALDDVELRKAKKEDQDLAEKAEAHKDAASIYREGFKANKLKIEFMKRVLDDKGGFTSSATKSAASASGSFSDKLKAATGN